MAKFMLITVGFEKPTPEIMEQWMNWFKSIGEKMVDQVGLMNGRDVSKEGEVTELQMDKDALTGYLIIDVENIDVAEEIAKACPAITSTKVYQIMEHK